MVIINKLLSEKIILEISGKIRINFRKFPNSEIFELTTLSTNPLHFQQSCCGPVYYFQSL